MWQALKRLVLGQNSHRVARKKVSAFNGPRGQFQHFNKALRLPSPAGAAFGMHARRGAVLQQLQSIMLFKAQGLNVLASFEQKYGFKPRVGASLVEGGGCGVFMQGTCAAGSMVAVYPGLVVRDMRSVDELTYGVLSSPPAVHYIASMPDTHASTISGCHLSLHAAIVRVEAQKSKNALIMKCPQSPCACATAAQHATWSDLGWVTPDPVQHHESVGMSVGHLVNHPPHPVLPNVALCCLELTRDECSCELRRHLPYVDTDPDHDVVKAVVLVALRDISDGEELHFDYGYDASSKHCPDWFEPVCYPAGTH